MLARHGRIVIFRSKITANNSTTTSTTPGREHLLDDSRRGYDNNEKFGQPYDSYHDAKDTLRGRDPNYKHQTIVSERGRQWIVGRDLKEGAYGQDSIPFTPRKKMFVWGNYSMVMKSEFVFFYVPGLIILGLILPAFTMSFAYDEAVNTTMTVKVLGRQWYWIYDVESPTDEE